MIKSYDQCKMAIVDWRMALCTLFVVIILGTVSCDVSKRNVTVKTWPDCKEKEYKADCDIAKQNGSNVVYVKAAAPDDSLLYAFSTIGMPTIVLARVKGGEADMHFNWTKIINESSLEDAITISGSELAVVEYKFGVAFTRLIEYNDKDDSADLEYNDKTYNSTDYWNIRDFSTLNWVVEQSNTVNNSFVFNATSEQDYQFNTSVEQDNTTRNWSISFTFTVEQDSGRSPELPSLKYGVNETLFDFIIANHTPAYANSRFAVEAVFVSQSTNEMKVDTIDSIDDEYSPGVFEIVNWLSNPSNQHESGYFQWKPVCYNTKGRSRSTATKVKHYDLSDLNSREYMTLFLNRSIIFALFGNTLYNDKLVITRTTNISFGLSEDGFYTKNNYTAWTAAIGYGDPPVDTISLTVIIIISAGLGLPVIILIFGGVYTCVKKAKKRSQYESINSETQPKINSSTKESDGRAKQT